MKKNLINGLFCAVSLFLIAACGRLEFPESLLSREGFPVEIQQDFFDRNGGNVHVLEAWYSSSNGNASISFEDPAGHSCRSEYENGDWQLTLREYDRDNPVSYLPRTVGRAFKELGFEAYCPMSDDDRVAEISRRGIEHKYYEFRFHTELGPNHYALHFVLIDEEGVVLENANSYFNRMDYSMGYDEALSFIADRYASCDVRGLANDSGYDTFYIFHDGRLKRVRFQNNFKVNYDSAAEGWRETVWQLDGLQDVPGYVWEEFQTCMGLRPESERYRVAVCYYLETPRGNYFGLEGPVSETTRIMNWFEIRN